MGSSRENGCPKVQAAGLLTCSEQEPVPALQRQMEPRPKPVIPAARTPSFPRMREPRPSVGTGFTSILRIQEDLFRLSKDKEVTEGSSESQLKLIRCLLRGWHHVAALKVIGALQSIYLLPNLLLHSPRRKGAWVQPPVGLDQLGVAGFQKAEEMVMSLNYHEFP